jgi:hypothetical protein
VPGTALATFLASFNSVDADVQARLVVGPAGAKGCAVAPDTLLTPWIQTLDMTPISMLTRVNGYLVRVQVALAECRAGAVTAASSASVTARAQDVRTLAATVIK